MNKIVEHANLPHNVRQLALGSVYSELLDEALRRLDIEPLYCPANPYIDKRLAGHCDLSVLHAGGDELFLSPHLSNSDFSKKLQSAGLTIVYPQLSMKENYPNDAQLNLCIVKNTFFYSLKVSESSAVDYITGRDLTAISVKQGYCRCSICVVNERSIITSDMGIHSKAIENGFDCLLINPGHISLPGFDYGFIGGSTFKISDEVLCFTGSLDDHPDKSVILDFLDKHSVRPVFLTDMRIFDIGSAVPLTEK